MDYIEILGAREHNLKSISLKIPRNNFVLVTGVSGSGKSSLVQSVIANEGQRLYLSQLNSKARQYFGKLNKPEIDSIKGLSPVVALDQISFSSNSRSTVGTLCDIYDYLRLLFARYGVSINDSDLKISRSNFSFNSVEGACDNCKGLGLEEFIDPETFIINPDKSIMDGAISLTTPSGYVIYSQVTLDVLEQVCRAEGFELSQPWNDLSLDEKNVILYGSNKIKIPFGKHTLESRMKWTGITAKPREEGYYKGMIPVMEEILKRDRNKNILKYTRSRKCSQCDGKRLNSRALEYRWMGRDIAGWASLSVSEISSEISSISQNATLKPGEKDILNAIITRSDNIKRLGVDYLNIDRDSTTLSVGEIKRLRLSGLLQNVLQGLVYTLDEPTVGLHPRDHHNLLSIMREISEKGNTVIVIDHKNIGFDYADYWIELGPDAGYKGGELIFAGSDKALNNINTLPESPSWAYYSGQKKISRKTEFRKEHCSWIKIKDADKNNLKIDSIKFQASALNVICGVSGAGKSSLLSGTIYPLLAKSQQKDSKARFEFSGQIHKVIKIDQKPIGRNSRSNPATYTKLFDKIRDLFGKSGEAKEMGLNKSDFSFNVDGGRCPECLGAGANEVGVSYLGVLEQKCEKCKGKRFKDEILRVNFKERNIFEILEMEVDEALEFFVEEKTVFPYLDWLAKLGLGYLKLGQPSNTLSGGEAQRIKLATELVRPPKGHTVYLLDEPASGLHQHDIQALLNALDKLIYKGHTLIMVEHDTDIVSTADWVVELGPESGLNGGNLVFEGRPADLLNTQTHMSIAIKEAAKRREKSTIPGKTQKDYNPKIPSGIKFNGVSTNNLKNIDIELLPGKINAIAGVSGSGKSSLIYDTIYKSAQYYFTQTYSTYLRTILGGDKPGVFRSASGLLPALSIRQKAQADNARSILATITGIYPTLRLLFSRFSLDNDFKRSGLLGQEFSFNDKSGACISCSGLGYIKKADQNILLSDDSLSVYNGAFAGSRPGKFFTDPDGQFMAVLKTLESELKLDLNQPWASLPLENKEIVLFGTGEDLYKVKWDYKRKNIKGSHDFESSWKGLVNLITDEYAKRSGTTRQAAIEPLMEKLRCPQCKGKRLRPERLKYKLLGKDIVQWLDLSVDEFLLALADIHSRDKAGAYQSSELEFMDQSLEGVKIILNTLSKLGLGYLQLGRSSSTLSSGEYQRARIAAQLSSELCGLLYLIDEPSTSLHPANLEALWEVFENICSSGNTIALVDHNPLFYGKADKIVHLGPGGGTEGGQIIQVEKEEKFSKLFTIPVKRENFNSNEVICHLESGNKNNLKIKNLFVPKGWTNIVGVSGSGKSSLLSEILRTLSSKYPSEKIILPSKEVSNWQWHNNPLMGLGILDKFRKVFVSCLDDQTLKIKPDYFNLSRKGGRCEKCDGKGELSVSLDFLGSSTTNCEKCNGTGLDSLARTIKSRGFSFNEILNMSLREILESGIWKEFDNELHSADQLGLGYLKAGQSGTSLSSGEKQRLLLLSKINTNDSGEMIYLFDEPGRGLHSNDSSRFVTLIKKIIARGHSVIMIEHSPSIIVNSDWLIELGPGGGEAGGQIIFNGPPQKLSSQDDTATIRILKKLEGSDKGL